MPRPEGAICQTPCPDTIRARAWRLIRKFRRQAEFTLDDLIHGADGRERSNLRKYITALAENGILEVTARKNGKASRYRRLRDPGPVSPILRADGGLTDPNRRAPIIESDQDSIRAKAWRSMRACGMRREEFTARHLAECIFDGDYTLSNLQGYLSALTKSGHIQRVRHGIYRIVKDTGPLSPIVRRNCTVYDPNTGCEHRIDEVSS